MIRVVATGTFDLIHPGHEFFLREAKKLGDHLTVIVSRDETVKRVKQRPPIHSEAERLDAIRKLGLADEVALGRLEEDKHATVLDLKPNVVALGYDQAAFTDHLERILKERGLTNVRVVRLPAFKPEEYKSTILRQRLERKGKL